jgi:hypothetical protein
MPKEHFPRLRSKNFSYADTFNVPSHQAGRLDLIMGERYAEPRAYKAMAAANGILDAFTTRPGIRPSNEALQNELVLRGVKPSEVKRMADDIDEMRILGSRDWLSYGNMVDGNITDVYPGRIMFVPTPDTSVAWMERYNELVEVDDEEL